MMPLKIDGNYRGPHASHVKGHRKLGKHRTIITAAIPLVDWLLEQDFVTKVELGRVVNGTGKKFSPRTECTCNGRRMRVLLVATDGAQVINITVRTDGATLELTKVITLRWLSMLGQMPHVV